jgi:hypothetical protein
MALKRTTQEVKDFFAQNECQLLDCYKGCLIPMLYKCSCGNYGRTSWNNFTKGKRCGKCSKYRRRYNLEQVQEIFKERGMHLLSKKYNGNKIPLKYRCKCGRISKISLVALIYQNQSCKKCGVAKNTGVNHHQWHPDRNKLREKQLFRKKIYKALASSLKATGKEKIGRTSDMLGYGPKELQEYIVNHPNWINVKNTKWHIDHIFPIKAFIDYGITDIALINCLDNLQPLSETENISKHDKYNKKSFEEWLNIFMKERVVIKRFIDADGKECKPEYATIAICWLFNNNQLVSELGYPIPVTDIPFNKRKLGSSFALPKQKEGTMNFRQFLNEISANWQPSPDDSFDWVRKGAKHGDWNRSKMYHLGQTVPPATEKDSIPMKLGYDVYNVFQRYWDGQSDPLYAVLSRRGNSVDWVTVFASPEEVKRLKQVAEEILKTSQEQGERRTAQALLQRLQES